MKFIVCEDHSHLAEVVSDLIIQQVTTKPDSVICIPTGGTPIPAYQRLIEKSKNLDFSRVSFFNLDEYLGLPPTHEQSYQSFLKKYVLDPLNIALSQQHLLRSDSPDPISECFRNDAQIDAFGGFDLMLDGIGENGHIAFNEPSDHFEARTHIAEISTSTRLANARFFNSLDEVPHQAISVGFEDIIKAKHLILMATGPRKALVIERLVSESTISCDFPISFLRMHPNVTIVLDKAACGRSLNVLINKGQS